MSIFRTARHIYAQIIDPSGGRVLASASSLEAELRADLQHGGNIAAAAVVGKRIAEKAIAAGVDTVAFDRSGFRYHGRVKALADAAREGGLKF
jgi:large subunit ribosomal protein L18